MQTTHVSLWRCFLAIALVFGASGAVRGGAWQDAVLQSNPIHWYRMNETSGTAASDSATNGAALNGTYQNGFTLGKSGAIDGAVGFDGNYGRVFLGGDKLPDTQPWTAEFVIRRTHNTQDMILSSAGNTHYLRQWANYQFLNPVGARTNEMIYSKGFLMPPVNATPLNKWAHVVWVGSTNAPASVSVYVDGTWMGSRANFMPLPLQTIGRDSSNPSIKGDLDEVALYDRVLTAQEIRAHALASGLLKETAWSTAIGASAPLHWYRFNESDGVMTAVNSASGGSPLYGRYERVTDLQQGRSGPIDGVVRFEKLGRVVFGNNHLALNQPWTAEFVLRPLREQYQFLVASTNDAYRIFLGMYSYTNQLGYGQSGVNDYRFTPNVFHPGTNDFIHLVFQGDPTDGAKGSVSVYLNNRLKGVCKEKFIPLPLHYLGRYDAGSWASLQADVDEVVFYDRLLPQEEIQLHYQVLHPPMQTVIAIR